MEMLREQLRPCGENGSEIAEILLRQNEIPSSSDDNSHDELFQSASVEYEGVH